jgi:mannose-6-phosphate isomerase-like protein (cupin superfamily)
MKKLVVSVLAVVATYLIVGTLVDSVILPEAEPGPAFYPPPGYEFVSKSEGFRQKVLKRENGLFWLELELEPHAEGPPEHVHTSFAEHFAVAEGTLSILFQGQRRLLRAGETLLVPPGTPHKPFNETGSRVVVRGPMEPEYAMPELFSVFLTQAYGFFDESPSNNQPPAALLQMSRFAPKYDSWLAGTPIPVQKTLFFLIRPAARLLGYRTHYEKYMPKSQRP